MLPTWKFGLSCPNVHPMARISTPVSSSLGSFLLWRESLMWVQSLGCLNVLHVFIVNSNLKLNLQPFTPFKRVKSYFRISGDRYKPWRNSRNFIRFHLITVSSDVTKEEHKANIKNTLLLTQCEFSRSCRLSVWTRWTCSTKISDQSLTSAWKMLVWSKAITPYSLRPVGELKYIFHLSLSCMQSRW